MLSLYRVKQQTGNFILKILCKSYSMSYFHTHTNPGLNYEEGFCLRSDPFVKKMYMYAKQADKSKTAEMNNAVVINTV